MRTRIEVDHSTASSAGLQDRHLIRMLQDGQPIADDHQGQISLQLLDRRALGSGSSETRFGE